MFDSIQMKAGRQSVTFNSVAGTLVKSSPDSKFVRFDMKSPLASYFFSSNNPRRSEESSGKYYKPIAVLQIMLCGDNQLLVEFMDLQQ